jgi:hypothetical protein
MSNETRNRIIAMLLGATRFSEFQAHLPRL